MRKKVFLVPLLLCLAILGSTRPGLTDSSSPIPADLFDHLQKQGWIEVSPGVMQRSLGGNRVETLGFGAAGLRFELRKMKTHLADLREVYAQQPSRQLRVTIRAHRAQILRIEEALRKAQGADGLEVSAESLIDPGSACSATYDAAAIAYPLSQGTASKAVAYFNSACSETGEVYAHSMSSATTEEDFDVIATKSDPASNTPPRTGSNLSATATTGVNGVRNCHSYAYASVLNYDTGMTYSQDDNNYSCVSSLPSPPWTKSDVGAVGSAGNASENGGVFKLIAGGTDLAGTADAFHFVHQPLTGDGTIVANVTALLKPVGATRMLGGVTFRNDLTAGSAHATMTITSEGEAQFRRRATANGTTASNAAATTFAPQWLKLVRSGNTFTAYLSANGTTWTQVGTPQTVTMSSTVYVGLVALRNGGTTTGAARFEGVALTIPPNRNPVALADTASTKQGVAVTIPVLANDSDPDGHPLTVTSVTTPTSGSAVIQAGGGAVIYTPGTPPSASFTYTVSDGRGGTATATVSVTIIPNTAPDALGDQIRVSYNTPLTIQHSTLLANDFDADGDARTITGFNTAGIVGTLSCPAGGTSCTYTPPTGYRWVTSYTYTVSDGRGGTDTATVKLKVGVTQSAPVAVDDFFTTTRNTAKAFTIYDILANDTDPDGDVLNPTISSTLDYGAVSCSSPIYNCAYTPNAGFIGNDRFYYGVTDTTDGSASAYIQMTVLPPATPVLDAREEQRKTGMNQALSLSYGSLVADDYDPEGDVLTVTSTDSTGIVGTLACNATGCTYTPPTNYTGVTKFRYTVSDGHGNSDTAIVRIRVGGYYNNAPVSNNDALITRVNTPLRFSIFELMKNDYDPDNDPLNVTVYSNAGHGTVTCSYPTYWCTYTPAANFTGTDSFAYALGDGITYSAGGSMVNVTVTP